MPDALQHQKLDLKLGPSLAFEVVLNLVLIFCCVGSVPPAVNESHYLPKAKHAWDSNFASGGDIFLESSNTHWLASASAGLLSRVMDFSTVAWIGRVASWLLLSIAWIQVCRAAEIPRLFRPTSFLAWFLWNHYGNWAGEWFVGGFEAKSIAYPCVLFGLAGLLRSQWNRVWIWSGTAIAWHPVVGGWALLGFFAVWLPKQSQRQHFVHNLPGIFLGGLIGLIGVIPALGGIGGNDIQDNVSAAQVHCFYRLSHHLSPQTFASIRNSSALISMAALIIVTLLSLRFRLTESYVKVTKPLLALAWTAVFVSMVGWLLDRATLFGLRQDIAARLLRFYFFRWSDVVVPLAVILIVVGWLSALRSLDSTTGHKSANRRFQYSTFVFTVLITVLGVLHWRQLNQMQVPPADLLLLKSVGPVPVRWESDDESSESTIDVDSGLPFRWATDTPVPQRAADWLAVCQWIRENTPPDSLWLTPKYQQTFKWYACRAEVVNWKDIPQDSRSIIEWYRRIERCQPPRDRSGVIRGWTTDELLELARQYRFQWVLLDRTYQEVPPLLESKYPNLIENRSFAVFYISTDAIR